MAALAHTVAAVCVAAYILSCLARALLPRDKIVEYHARQADEIGRMDRQHLAANRVVMLAWVAMYVYVFMRVIGVA